VKLTKNEFNALLVAYQKSPHELYNDMIATCHDQKDKIEKLEKENEELKKQLEEKNH